MIKPEEGRLKYIRKFFSKYLYTNFIKKCQRNMLLGFPCHVMEKDLYVLVVFLFDDFFHQNKKI